MKDNSLKETAQQKYGVSKKVMSADVYVPAMYKVRVPDGPVCVCSECFAVSKKPSVSTETAAQCDACGAILALDCDTQNVEHNSKDGSFSFFIPKRVDAYVSKKDGVVTKCDAVTTAEHITVWPSLKVSHRTERTVRDYNMVDNRIASFQVPANAGGKADAMLLGTNRFCLKQSANEIFMPVAAWPRRGDVSNMRQGVADLPVLHDAANMSRPGETNRKPVRYSCFRTSSASYASACAKATEAMYKSVAEQYGLLESRLSSGTDAALEFITLYPAVVRYELNKLETNMDYEDKRRVEAGKLPFSDLERKYTRSHCLSETMRNVSLMDWGLSADLAKMETPDQVVSYLRSITFGGEPSVKMPKGVKIKPPANVDDGFNGKKLKKCFNINPYAAASNVRTALKLGLTDPSHLSAFLDIASSKPSRVSAVESSEGFARPLESQSTLRLARMIMKSRRPSDALKDIYTHDTMPLFLDSAAMYADVSKHKVVSGEADAKTAKVLSVTRRLDRMYERNGHDIDDLCRNETVAAAFGKDARQIVTYLLYQNRAYKEAGIDLPIYIATRDGRPLFESRTMREIHDELIRMSLKARTSEKGMNYHYDWSDKQKEIANKTIGDYSFRLAESSNDLINAGQMLQICVGSTNYDMGCRNGSRVIVLMEDKNSAHVACIELTGDLSSVLQFKGPRNSALCGEAAVEAAREWMREGNMQGCGDTEHFGDASYHPYGDANFAVNRRMMREAEIPSLTMEDCRKAFERLEETCSAKQPGKESGNALPDFA